MITRTFTNQEIPRAIWHRYHYYHVSFLFWLFRNIVLQHAFENGQGNPDMSWPKEMNGFQLDPLQTNVWMIHS